MKSIPIAIAMATFALAASPASAIDTCKAKVDKKNGVITVDVAGAGGPVLWGATQGNEANAFFNDATCVAGATGKKCQLADPSTLASKTPPPACTLYLDDGVQACEVWIRGCIPGPREVNVDLVQMDADVTAHAASLVTLSDKTQCLTSTSTDAYITDCNLHILSGSGTTDGAANGRGNLIVGYNETTGQTRTGSHNLVVGRYHSYTSWAGFVAGEANTVSAARSSVLGGQSNAANGIASSIVGGYLSLASGEFSSIGGGVSNTAAGKFSVVSGGGANQANHQASTVSGGTLRTASGQDDWVAGALFQDN